MEVRDLGGLPDVRDGLTRLERAILVELARAEQELGGRNVPTAMLYGRVVEHVEIGVPEFQRALNRLVGAPNHQIDHQVGGAKPR
jgi:hypothetical protein